MGKIVTTEMIDMMSTLADIKQRMFETKDNIKGLNNLVNMFYMCIQNEYCGPEKGSPEYYQMIEETFSHIITTLDGVAETLDDINTDVDRVDRISA